MAARTRNGELVAVYPVCRPEQHELPDAQQADVVRALAAGPRRADLVRHSLLVTTISQPGFRS
jgi:hypothetical protein